MWPGPFEQGEAARRVLFAYAAAGMPAVEVRKAATINAAKFLGLENRAGVLKADAFADIIAINGDPVSDLTSLERVKFVMKSGTVYVGR